MPSVFFEGLRSLTRFRASSAAYHIQHLISEGAKEDSLRLATITGMMNQQELLQYAIQGLEAERAKIDQLLSELKSQVHGAPAEASSKHKGRSLSAKGRANIRAALKRRWAAFHQGKTVVVPKKKRTLSPAQLEAMRKNAAKARAAALKKAQGK